MMLTPSAEKDWSEKANPGNTITYFGGADRSEDLRILDNFNTTYSFTIDSKSYPSIEHAFQSLKFTLSTPPHPSHAEKIRLASTPQEAKRLGREVRLSREFLDLWGKDGGLGEETMRRCQDERFQQNEEAKKVLMELKGELLVEKVEDDPTWDDKIWGCGKNYVGKNKMGVILMELRAKYMGKE